MKILNITNQNISDNINFNGAKSRKLIEKISNSKQLKKMDITFDELVRMYNEIGYDVILKRGSHAAIPLTDEITISVVIPHGSEKYVKPNDLKRFLLVKENKFIDAAKIR